MKSGDQVWIISGHRRGQLVTLHECYCGVWSVILPDGMCTAVHEDRLTTDPMEIARLVLTL